MKSNRYLNRHGLTFACLYALDPCVTKVGIASVSAFLEPSAAASAATEFAGLLDDAALPAYGTHRLCCLLGIWKPLEACIRRRNR